MVVGTFALRGINFNLIPQDAVGVLMVSNDDPLFNRDTTFNNRLFDLNVISDTELTATQRNPSEHNTPSSIGAILSQDRQTVYWVNDMRPLP